MRCVGLRFHRSVQLHYPGVPLKIEALPCHTNRILRIRTRRLLPRDVFPRRRQRKLNISQQPSCPFFGVILDSHGFPIPIRKEKLHGLLGPRHPTGAVKDHAAGLHVYFLSCGYFRIFCSPLHFRQGLQIELNFAAACHASALFFVLAALRMNRVVPLSSLSEDGDLHVFQQTGVLIPEIRGLRCLHRENLLVSFHLRKGEPVRAARHIFWSRRWRVLRFPISDPFALQIHSSRPTCHQQPPPPPGSSPYYPPRPPPAGAPRPQINPTPAQITGFFFRRCGKEPKKTPPRHNGTRNRSAGNAPSAHFRSPPAAGSPQDARAYRSPV